MNKQYFLVLSIITLVILTQTESKSQVLISLIFGDKLNSEGLEFGLDGGFNYAGISGLESSSRLVEFNIGFYFDIAVKNQWSLYTGVLVKSNHGANKLTANDLVLFGVDTIDTNGTYRQKLGYFNVPLMVKYRFKNRIFIKAGPMAGLINSGILEYNYKEGPVDVNIKTKNKEQFNPLEMGLIGGIGYKIKESASMNFGVRYYYGLTNVLKGVEIQNNSIYLFATIPVGAGKKE